MDTDLRRVVRDRAGNRCEYCDLQQAHAPHVLYTVDHVLPKKHGGNDEEANLALACYRCNLHKGPNLADIDPKSGEMVALFNPRQQSWPDHFDRIGAVIVGLTPTGRTTVRVLAMNALERRELRQELIDNGELE
jgi:hypothetical protein